MNIIDYEHYTIRTTMEPVIESIVKRIDELESQIADMNLAITNAVSMFPIIVGRLKRTEETYDVILKFIKLQEKNSNVLQEKKSNELFEKMEKARKINNAHKECLKEG